MIRDVDDCDDDDEAVDDAEEPCRTFSIPNVSTSFSKLIVRCLIFFSKTIADLSLLLLFVLLACPVSFFFNSPAPDERKDVIEAGW